MQAVRNTFIALTLGSLLMGQSALAGHARYDRARVVDVRPIYEVVRVPVSRAECWTDRVEHRHEATGAGTLVGAVIGGVVGRHLATGHDRFEQRVATAAGAVIGGAVGKDMEERRAREPRWHEERHCRVTESYHEEERLAGYRVRYRYRGETYTTEMDRDPGRFVRVRVDVRPVE